MYQQYHGDFLGGARYYGVMTSKDDIFQFNLSTLPWGGRQGGPSLSQLYERHWFIREWFFAWEAAWDKVMIFDSV